MKNSAILILKGVLFYGTALSIILFIGGIDSIWSQGLNRLFLCIIQVVVNIILCLLLITKDDLKQITFYDKIDEILKE